MKIKFNKPGIRFGVRAPDGIVWYDITEEVVDIPDDHAVIMLRTRTDCSKYIEKIYKKKDKSEE